MRAMTPDQLRRIGIIDCMISFPANDYSRYDFIRKQLKDQQSTDFDFPVEYMFKNVPKELYGEPRTRSKVTLSRDGQASGSSGG